MSGYQKITIIGHLGREPEMRYTEAGKAVTNFSVAVSRKYGDTEETTWFNVDAWEKLAETANKYLAKGKIVHVEGRVSLNQYKHRETGENVASLRVTAQAITLIDPRRGEDGDGEDATGGGSGEMPF